MSATTTVDVKISIEGEEIKGFTGLSIQQSLADICSGSFGYRDDGSTSHQGQVYFNEKVFFKSIIISIGNHFTFNGVIDQVRMHNEDGLASEYIIHFSGGWIVLCEIQESNVHLKKSFNEIIKKTGYGMEPVDWPDDPEINKAPIHYTVQYNQSPWQYIKMLAAREGAWLYYDGTDMHMARPGKHKMTLKKGKNVHNITLATGINASPVNFTGFNSHEGDFIHARAADAANQGLHKAAFAADAKQLKAENSNVHIGTAFDKDQLERKASLHRKARAANAVTLTASTQEPGLNLGTLVKIEEAEDSTGSNEYIVVQLSHSVSNNEGYTAYCTMIPANVEVPPYTNPFIYTQASQMHGIVKDNVDKDDRQDRVKVYLPFMPEGGTSCWMDLLLPYAGDGRGSVWLPEIEDEVLVDFIGNDIERPYVAGCIYTHKNKSNRDTEGNHVKSTTTASGRGFAIDDKKGVLSFKDNLEDQYPQSRLNLTRKDTQGSALLTSGNKENSASFVKVDSKEGTILAVIKNGEQQLLIVLDKEENEILIQSKKNIRFIAEGDISMKGKNITLNAEQQLNLNGEQGGVQVKGQKVTLDAHTGIGITATTELELNGKMALLHGKLQTDVSCDGMMSISGAIVQIN